MPFFHIPGIGARIYMRPIDRRYSNTSRRWSPGMFMRWRKMTRRPVWSRYIPSSAERRQMLMPQKRKPDQRFQRFHHRDILRRPYSGRRDTRFLNSKDGRPTELVVQSSEEVLANKSALTGPGRALITRVHGCFALLIGQQPTECPQSPGGCLLVLS